MRPIATTNATPELTTRVEKQLKLAGFKPNVDALKQFQSSWGLPATGVVDARTKAKLDHVQQRIKGHDDRFLSVGQKSGQIYRDEQRLKALGYDVGKVDGVFDLQTRDAVERFRKDDPKLHDVSFINERFDKHLKAQREAIAHAPQHIRVKPSKQHRRLDTLTAAEAKKEDGIGKGSNKRAIINVQNRLRAAGFNPMHNKGAWDERTEGMVKHFQKKEGLPATGRVDSATWKQLQKTWLYAKDGISPAQRRDERSSAVAKTEKQLKQLGYKVKADRVFGADTERAVERFQKKHKLPVTGQVGVRTSRALAKAVKNLTPHSSNPFINRIGKGAIESMRKTGVPASVTIAQAILESGWGKSGLAKQANNLFGIKGKGPAGSVTMRTREVVNGQSIYINAAFRKYHNQGESLVDHAKLLATSSYYRKAMSHRNDPNQFARDLTGVYATDPNYAKSLIGIMKQYDLYKYDRAARR